MPHHDPTTSGRWCDPVAIFHLGTQYERGKLGLEKNATKAVQLYKRAAELGLIRAHCDLGNCYCKGVGVDRDPLKAIKHWEKAALRGDVGARYNLGLQECVDRNYD